VRGGRVEVRTPDGRILQASVEVPLGHPSRPVSDERLRQKFRDCCRYAALRVDSERLLQAIERLEEADEVEVLTG
jgi:2-methylcitrate dehydratase PrpD